MRKVLLLLVLFLGLTSFKLDNTVYVCGTSKIYHPNTTHNSFNNCNHTVIKMLESEAISAGKRSCKCKR